MSTSYSGEIDGRGGLDRVLGDLRPKLHRYTARMTGSAIDGEDVVQDAIVKAIEAFPEAGAIANVEGWMFRILHHAALDFLRRRGRLRALHAGGDPDMIVDPVAAVGARQVAAAGLRTFMALPASHRSCVILMDVLGYALDEIAGMTGLTVPAVKAALHKGRIRLRQLAAQPDDNAPPALDDTERRRLAAYVDRFNARDFDALRELLAEDVRLDLFGKSRRDGRTDVSRYFENYRGQSDWHLVAGLVEGRPGILVFDPAGQAEAPSYVVLLDWSGERIGRIRDFRYARYMLADAQILRVGRSDGCAETAAGVAGS